MKGECKINGRDAYEAWGVILGETSLSALMTPAPQKAYIENACRTEHGKRILTDFARMDERTLQLTFAIVAKSREEFLTRYNAFMGELGKGAITLETRYQKGVIYHLVYLSCAQFSVFNGKLAKFVLKLNEPNPSNRQ